MNARPRRLSLKREALTDLTADDLRVVAAGANKATQNGQVCVLLNSLENCSIHDCTSNTWACTGGC